MDSKDYKRVLFEIKEENEDNIILQRTLNKDKYSKKEYYNIINNLPTTTITTFSNDDFERLKLIGKEIINKNKKEKKISLVKEIRNFLEI